MKAFLRQHQWARGVAIPLLIIGMPVYAVIMLPRVLYYTLWELPREIISEWVGSEKI